MFYSVPVLLLALASYANAGCQPQKLMFKDRIGLEVWLAANDDVLVPQNRSNEPNLWIPALEQTGPSNWQPSKTEAPFAQGTRARVLKAIYDEDGYVDYFEIKTENDRIAVIDPLHAIGFDYRDCAAEQILFSGSVAIPLGKLRGLPMVPTPGARPIKYGGDWMAEGALDGLVYLNCHEYGDIALTDGNWVNCSPVWEQGVDGYDGHHPLSFYFKSDELMQITTVQ